MNPTSLFLRNILAVQGFFYLATNLWGLVGTRHFLLWNNPGADLFEARGFAALGLVLALYFLAGAWKTELQRPASFLGLGSALAIALVELFHLPEMGRSLLWIDLLLEVLIAALYVNFLFFRREKTGADAAPAAREAAATAVVPPLAADEPVRADEPDAMPDIDASPDAGSGSSGDSSSSGGSAD